MGALPKTGNGGTIVLGTSALAFGFTKIGEWQTTRGKLESSVLATTGFKEYEPDDLAEPGEIEVEGIFDGTDEIDDINAVEETITVTYPKTDSTSAAGASLAGTGFLIQQGTPELVNGSLMKAKFKIAFSGKTGPAFTKEA
jgi:hypothetical protein